jgi:hypothetical protein
MKIAQYGTAIVVLHAIAHGLPSLHFSLVRGQF